MRGMIFYRDKNGNRHLYGVALNAQQEVELYWEAVGIYGQNSVENIEY